MGILDMLEGGAPSKPTPTKTKVKPAIKTTGATTGRHSAKAPTTAVKPSQKPLPRVRPAVTRALPKPKPAQKLVPGDKVVIEADEERGTEEELLSDELNQIEFNLCRYIRAGFTLLYYRLDFDLRSTHPADTELVEWAQGNIGRIHEAVEEVFDGIRQRLKLPGCPEHLKETDLRPTSLMLEMVRRVLLSEDVQPVPRQKEEKPAKRIVVRRKKR